MQKKVLKFGGSNLKTPSDLNNIIQVVKAYNEPVVITLSAFYGVTDKIKHFLLNGDFADKAIEDFIEELCQLKYYFIKNLVDDFNYLNTIEKLNCRISELRNLLKGIGLIGELPLSTNDLIMSYGERLSSLIITDLFNIYHIKSKELLPENFGLITDGEFGNASVDFEASEKLISNAFNEDICYVVPGFYGISRKQKITLLGRGGTDYTAASIARCINAKTLDVWKDVEGFKSADPKICENTEVIEGLTYSEAAELSYFGAKILHPRTVEPLEDVKIPIRLFDITKPDLFPKPGTVINGKNIIKNNVIKSITYSDDFGIVKLKGAGVGIKAGILARVTTEFDRLNINIKSMITAQTSINILLSEKDTYIAADALHKLEFHTVNKIQVRDNIAVIAVVGAGMADRPGIASRIFSSVAKKNINVEMIALGASKVASYFIVQKNEKLKAIELIHNEFFA